MEKSSIRGETSRLAELMTLEEVASYLRVTEKTVYRLVDRRAIPAAKVGHQWRFDRASVDNWLHQNSTGSAADILVIDDDAAVCSLFADALEGSGHRVTAVNEPAPGLDMVREKEFDMVFLDLRLPGTDGAEVFRQIKAVKPGLPVTIITGFPDSELMMRALAHGPFGVMKKPFGESDILAAVNSYLRFGKLAR